MITKILVPIISVLALSACTQKENTQTMLKQSVYNLETTYTMMEENVMPFVTRQVPGVKVSQVDKQLIFKASNTVYNEIKSLKDSIDKNEPLSITLVNATIADLQSLINCWTDIHVERAPTACGVITQGENKIQGGDKAQEVNKTQEENKAKEANKPQVESKPQEGSKAQGESK